MKPFMDDDFLLENKYSKALYHEYARKMPIIDYHNHLSPKLIANNTAFANLAQAWIHGDHYKWRAMRTLGISEEYITGKANDQEKFNKWAYTVPYTMKNPLYHWTHLELQRYFGISERLSPKSAGNIYTRANELLRTSEYSCQGLLNRMNVTHLCTTEDPTDTLEHHQTIAKSNLGIKVSTAFRPDKAIHLDATGFNAYMEELGEASGIAITSFDALREALAQRLAHFHENGCRIADHGLPHMYAADYTETEVDTILKRKLENKTLQTSEIEKYKSAVLHFLSAQYHRLQWVQQFHLGPLRNNNSRMMAKMGPDTGWDSIGDTLQAQNLSLFLDRMDRQDTLAKTILYNLNPRDNAVFATMAGNFNDGSIKGKVQWGSGWWFLDQKQGMEEQLTVLGNMGLLSCFVGMLTDSRSFLSFPRHEYFRRILCNLLGKDMANGELPHDLPWIGKMVQDICYNNAKEYFNL